MTTLNVKINVFKSFFFKLLHMEIPDILEMQAKLAAVTRTA